MARGRWGKKGKSPLEKGVDSTKVTEEKSPEVSGTVLTEGEHKGKKGTVVDSWGDEKNTEVIILCVQLDGEGTRSINIPESEFEED